MEGIIELIWQNSILYTQHIFFNCTFPKLLAAWIRNKYTAHAVHVFICTSKREGPAIWSHSQAIGGKIK